MLRGMILSIATLTLLGLASSQAQANPVTWDVEGGAANFDNSTITFTPFVADTLLSFTGDGIYHEHNSADSTTVTLDVRVDGSWINLYSHTIGGPFSNYAMASVLPTPISFASGSVDGLRLLSSIPSSATFHFWDGNTPDVFTFASTQAVPEPTSMALFGLTALGMGVVRRRRKSAADEPAVA